LNKFTQFSNRNNFFWSAVKLISEGLGYSDRKAKKIKYYNSEEVNLFEKKLSLNISEKKDIVDYLNLRSDIINNDIKNNLLNKEEAKILYESLLKEINPKSKISFNRQKKEKKHPAYFSNMISFICEKNLTMSGFVNDTQQLSFIEKDSKPYYTFSRRFDGVIPSFKNPLAVWEVKEYYNTTTFGSRIADGIYESLLDGFEINSANKLINKKIFHYLFIDGYHCWWNTGGKSYLCRIVDFLNMGYVDSVYFGKEIITEWDKEVKRLKEIYKN